MTEKMYAPLSWVMSKQPRNNVFLKRSFYTLLDMSLIKNHTYLPGFYSLK